ncbi:MAG: gluconokinase, GntK/IdnK-type [Pseudomonadota bacterium]
MSPPRLVVCMGVAGCGKSTLAQILADRWGWEMVEADHFHSAANQARMAAGVGLTDTERQPWMDVVCDELRDHRRRQHNVVLAHSALRRSARDRLRGCGLRAMFIHLTATPALIGRRLARRKRHFAGAELLTSQYLDLQSPAGEPDVVSLDAALSPKSLARRAEALMQQLELT